MDDGPAATKMATRKGTRHIELWTAVVILTGTIGSGAAAFVKNFNPDHAALAPKPLEGVWDMTLDYDMFHGETGSWSGKGKAIIIWQRTKQRYDVYFGVAIRKSGDQQPVLAGFSNGFIAADEDGWPKRSFAIENIEWIARAHAQGKEPSKAYYEYGNCTFIANESRADRIEGAFKTAITNGTMRLTWLSAVN